MQTEVVLGANRQGREPRLVEQPHVATTVAEVELRLDAGLPILREAVTQARRRAQTVAGGEVTQMWMHKEAEAAGLQGLRQMGAEHVRDPQIVTDEPGVGGHGRGCGILGGQRHRQQEQADPEVAQRMVERGGKSRIHREGGLTRVGFEDGGQPPQRCANMVPRSQLAMGARRKPAPDSLSAKAKLVRTATESEPRPTRESSP